MICGSERYLAARGVYWPSRSRVEERARRSYVVEWTCRGGALEFIPNVLGSGVDQPIHYHY